MNHRLPLNQGLMIGLLAACPTLTEAQPQRGAGGGPELQDMRDGPMEVIDLPKPMVSITVEGDYRVIRSNGLPDHAIGTFPNKDNPNALRPQQIEIKVPVKPKVADRPTPAMPEFGVGLNGVIFDAGTGEFWSIDGNRPAGGGLPGGAGGPPGGRGPGGPGGGPPGGGPGGPGGPDSAWNYDAGGGGTRFGLDQNHAHVQPTGKYHYHGVPTGLVAELDHHDHGAAADHRHGMTHIGWALDGFPIYGPMGYQDADDPASGLVELRPSYQLKAGERPGPPEGPGQKYDGTFSRDWEYKAGLGDLDESNGRFGVTPEFPEGTYYYVITDGFPSIPRLWHGEPGPTAKQRGGPGGGGPGGPGGGQRPPRR